MKRFFSSLLLVFIIFSLTFPALANSETIQGIQNNEENQVGQGIQSIQGFQGFQGNDDDQGGQGNQDNQGSQGNQAPKDSGKPRVVSCDFTGPRMALNDCTANAYDSCADCGAAPALDSGLFYSADHVFVKRDNEPIADPEWGNKLVWVLKCKIPGCQALAYKCDECGTLVNRTASPFTCKCIAEVKPPVYSNPNFISIAETSKNVWTLTFSADGAAENLSVQIKANNANLTMERITLPNGQILEVDIKGNGKNINVFRFI